MRTALVVLAGTAVGCVLACQTSEDVRQQAHHWVTDEHALLLDVRSPEEFAAGHLPGAVNIAVQELPARVSEVGSKDRPVVVYCAAGPRAARAARLLADAGHTRVLNLGAMDRW